MSILAETDDADLLNLVREGDQSAMAELWSRHYPATLAAARRVSRQPRDAEEFASDAFAGMLQAVSNNGGPSASVRGYLLVAVRNQAANRARRSSSGDVLTDEISDYEGAQHGALDPVAHHAGLGLVREAFGSLPRRWQHVLWRTAVDHDKNTVIAADLDMSPNAVAALARRARNGFRTAYIQAHTSTHGVAPECEAFVPRLVELLPGDGAVGAPEVRDHVEDCSACARRLADLRIVDRDLRGVLLPALLALGPGIAWATAGHATHAAGGALWLKLGGHGAGQSRKLAVLGTATAVTVAGACSAFALTRSGDTPPPHAATSTSSHSSVHNSMAPGSSRASDDAARTSATRGSSAADRAARSATALPPVSTHVDGTSSSTRPVLTSAPSSVQSSAPVAPATSTRKRTSPPQPRTSTAPRSSSTTSSRPSSTTSPRPSSTSTTTATVPPPSSPGRTTTPPLPTPTSSPTTPPRCTPWWLCWIFG